jgi:hypothetical protein
VILRSRKALPRWLPLSVAVGVALVLPSLWHQSTSGHVTALDENTPVKAERMGSPLTRRAAPLTDVLQELADAESARLRGSTGIEPQVLSALALERFSSVFAIAIVDRASGLRWIQARSTFAPSLADLEAIEQACEAVVRKPVDPVPTVVDRSDLPAGGAGLVIAVPVLDRGRLSSFVVGLLRHHDFFTAPVLPSPRGREPAAQP